MCFGKRIGSLLFNRVLGCQYKKRFVEFITLACDRDGTLLHGFQHGRLGFRGRAVDFIRKTNLSKNGSFLKLKLSFPIGILDDHVGTKNVSGHQVRGELNAIEIQIEGICQGANQHGFPQSRCTFEQAVAANQNGG